MMDYITGVSGAMFMFSLLMTIGDIHESRNYVGGALATAMLYSVFVYLVIT